MKLQELKARLLALKSANKVRNQFIDLLLKMVDGKEKVSPAFTRLLRIKSNKPIIRVVLDLLCRFILKIGEHEIITKLLKLLKDYL